MVNVQLGLFNLIPGFPLDGGRVLRAGLWAWNKDFNRATSQASLVGIGFGVTLGLIGAVLMVGAWSGALGQSTATNGGWLIFIGAFLFSAALAWANGRQPCGVPVDVGDSSPGHGPSGRDPATGYECAGRGRSILCRAWIRWISRCEEGQVLGVVTVKGRACASSALWPWRCVREIMRPVSSAFCIPPDWSAMPGDGMHGTGGGGTVSW